jgi:Domain of unknown function (DUF6438)
MEMDEYQAEITSITLRRGPCFGACPMYEVMLAADGAATWYGERFVDRLGRDQGQVDINDFGRLARFMQRAGFLDWEPEYLGNVTDLPDYFLTAVVGDQTKTVRQNGVDEPPDFWVIAAVVDGLAEAINWTAVPSMEGTCHDWAAFHDHMPPGPSVLRVQGTCRFNTAGYSVELRRHEPQGINPHDLLLDRIVTPPDGPVAQVVTEVDVGYSEETEFDYQTVTILPDGPSIQVEDVH